MSQKTIIIAEDNASISEEMVDILTMEGFKANVCSNGLRVLEIVKQTKPDLIISDHIMPKMSGAQLLEELKRDKELSRIPVIIISAQADKDFEKRILAGGAVKFLVKPISSDELTSTVISLFNKNIHCEEKKDSNSR